MYVKFYAHASFRLEGDGLSIITDPYTPGPDGSNFAPIAEPADLVIMSSDDDDFHSEPNHVTGDPVVINALELPPEGETVAGLHVTPFPVMEKEDYDDFIGHDAARDCAMYTFTLDEIRVLHIGDLGNPFTDEHLEALAGSVDVMFALAGGEATIALDDLDAAIQVIQPRVVIPMHFYHPRGVLDILPVTEFTDRYPDDMVTWVGGSDLELNPATLPSNMHIYVLEQSR